MADIELLIKIPEKIYNALRHTDFNANLVVDEMRKAIANGTLIPDNATNGDVITAMFDVEEYHLKTEPDDVFLRFKGEERTIWFSLDFWNAPYQKDF